MNREDVDFLTIDGKIDEANNTNYDATASLSRYADETAPLPTPTARLHPERPDGGFNVAATLTDVDDTLWIG